MCCVTPGKAWRNSPKRRLRCTRCQRISPFHLPVITRSAAIIRTASSSVGKPGSDDEHSRDVSLMVWYSVQGQKKHPTCHFHPTARFDATKGQRPHQQERIMSNEQSESRWQRIGLWVVKALLAAAF